MSTYYLTGGAESEGQAISKTETDTVVVAGAANIFTTIGGGNLTLSGANLPGSGYDTATTVYLGDDVLTDAMQKGTKIAITLDGGSNIVAGNNADNLSPAGGYAVLNAATVTVKLAAHGTAGSNLVDLDNVAGKTTVSLTGGANTVQLNGNATNTVVTGTGGAGGSTLTIGGDPSAGNALPTGNNIPNDGLSGVAKVTLDGGNNTVTIGDETLTLTNTGGAGDNALLVGGGNDTIALAGTGNFVAIGQGDDQITAGSGSDQVNIADNGLGIDTVVLAGAMNVVDEYSTTNLNFPPGGSNAIAVSDNTTGGGNTVLLGDGSDNIQLAGDANSVTLGNGTDSVVTSGNANVIAVGNGNYVVALGAGSNNTVTAGTGSTMTTGITGTGNNNTVTTADIFGSTVSVNLGNGSGNTIAVGNGHDTIVDNGAKVTVTAGYGGDTVTANGAGDSIAVLGSGNITANGKGDTISSGPASTITATGSGDTVTLNSFGSNAGSTLTLGANGTATVDGGTDRISGLGMNTETLDINASAAGSSLYYSGSNNIAFLSPTADLAVTFSGSEKADQILIDNNNSPTYGGALDVYNLGASDLIGLAGLGYTGVITNGQNAHGLGGTNPLNFKSNGLGDLVANVKGGGTIDLHATSTVTAKNFIFSSATNA